MDLVSVDAGVLYSALKCEGKVSALEDSLTRETRKNGRLEEENRKLWASLGNLRSGCVIGISQLIFVCADSDTWEPIVAAVSVADGYIDEIVELVMA